MRPIDREEESIRCCLINIHKHDCVWIRLGLLFFAVQVVEGRNRNNGVCTISDGKIDQNKTERSRNVYYNGFAFFTFSNGFRLGAVSLEVEEIV